MTKVTIDVVAMVADNGILTFYKTDGSVYTITQGDARGLAMTDEFIAQKSLNKEIVTLIISDEVVQPTGHLSNKNRNPLVRFFKAPLEAVMKLFGPETHDPQYSEESHEAAAAKVREIASRLMRGNVAESTEELPIRMVDNSKPLNEGETIIAVTKDGIVPQVENLTDQFNAADEGKAPATGVDNLILRIAAMSAKRGHSSADLIKFLKNSDLPIMADGAFLAYKRLIHTKNGVYVDPHTRNVHQRIGDIVEMDETLVDPNRSRDCSNGLHVGSRQYMGGFHGNDTNAGTMLVLVQPEDVIAVPQYDSTKMRVCRYLILGDLSSKAHALVNKNKAIDACEDTMNLLARITAGARPPFLGTVNIGGSYGTNLTYIINSDPIDTNVSYEEALSISKNKGQVPTKAITPVRTIAAEKNGVISPDKKNVKVRDKASAVKPADLKAKVEASKPVAAVPTRNEQAQALAKAMRDKTRSLLDRGQSAQELLNLKKKSKVSWDKLAVSGHDIDKEIQRILDTKVNTAKPTAPKTAPKAPVAKQAAKVKAKPEPKAEPVKAKEPIGKSPTETHQDAHQKRAVAEFEKGGQSKAQIASKYGTSPKSLTRWIEKYGKKA